MKRLVALALATAAFASPVEAAGVPRLDHAFVIVEENMSFDEVTRARAAEAPYLNGLARAHVRHGAYYAIAHASLANYTGLVSGQRQGWRDHWTWLGSTVHERSGPTIAAQLDRAGLSWRGYFESMPEPCTGLAGLHDRHRVGYATRHNPFVYFSEIAADRDYCRSHVVPYERHFAEDLRSGPPAFALIVPNTCNDGHDAGCEGDRTQPQVMDGWLAASVPPILEFIRSHPRSALFITFDESDDDDSSCCNQEPGRGGGHVDLVMVAPALERAAGYVAGRPANHFSLLRTLEEAFALPPLGASAEVEPMDELFREASGGAVDTPPALRERSAHPKSP
jgi:phosphatidylinositol-3-phosphatase